MNNLVWFEHGTIQQANTETDIFSDYEGRTNCQVTSPLRQPLTYFSFLFHRSLFELELCMENVKTFLKKVSEKGWFKKSRQKNEIRQKFNGLNHRLEGLIRSLMLSLLVSFYLSNFLFIGLARS